MNKNKLTEILKDERRQCIFKYQRKSSQMERHETGEIHDILTAELEVINNISKELDINLPEINYHNPNLS